MAKRNTFDFESFTRLLKRGFSEYISLDEVEELEDLWHMKRIDRAFSKAASMYHRLPEHKITVGLRHGIEAFRDETRQTPLQPKYATKKQFDSDKYVESPTYYGRHFDDGRYLRSPTHADRKEKNTYTNLVHYIKVLARGIRNNNVDDIEAVQHLDGTDKGIQDLRNIADDIGRLLQQINDLRQKNSRTRSLWDTAVDQLSKEKIFWHDRYVEIMFEKEQETSLRLKDTQERYSSSLLHKHKQLSESFNNLRNENVKLGAEIRKYVNIVEDLEKEISTLKKRQASSQKKVEELEAKCSELGERNSSLINQVQAKKVQLKKATKHAEATDTDNEELQDRLQEAERCIKQTEQEKREIEEQFLILKERTHRVGSSNQSHTEDLDKLRKDYDDLETRGTHAIQSSSFSLQKRVEELEAKCSELGERKSSLINQVQAKKVQLEKATKHVEAIDTEKEELQDRLKAAERRIKQIEQEKRELEQEYFILKESLARSHNQCRFQGTREPAEQVLAYEDEITRLKERIRDLEQGKARAVEHGTGVISYEDRLHNKIEKVEQQDQTSSRVKELETENGNLKSRLKTAIDIIDQPENNRGRRREFTIDKAGITDRNFVAGDEFILSGHADVRIKELEEEIKSLRKRLQDASDNNKQKERGEIGLEEHGTDISGFTDRFLETQDYKKQLENAQSKLEEADRKNRSLEDRLREALEKIDRLETDVEKTKENETGNTGFNISRLRSRFGKDLQSEGSDSRVRELETEVSTLQERLRDANDKINQLERDNSRLNDLISSGNPTIKERLHNALRRSPSDGSSSRIRELERENQNLENRLQEAMNRVHELDREVQKGSKDSYKSHSGKHKKKIQEKSEARVKELERENSSLQDNTSKLHRDMGEKDLELKRMTSQLQKAEDDKRELLTRLTFIKPENEGVLHTESQTKQLEQEKHDLYESNQQLQNQLQKQQQEVERLQTELKQRDDSRTEQNMTDMHRDTDGTPLTERQIERFEQQKENLLDRNKELQKQIDQLKEELSRSRTEHRQKDDYCNELSRNLTDMRRERDMAVQNDSQARQLEKEKQELQQRLDEALIDSNRVGELESLVMTLENQKRELEGRSAKEQEDEEKGIYSEGAPNKLKKKKKTKTDGLNQLQNVKGTEREGEVDPNGLAQRGADQIDSNMDPQIVPERQETELGKVKFELQVIKKQKSELQKRLNENVRPEGDLQKIGELEALTTKLLSEKKDLEEKLNDLQLGLERVHHRERRSSRSERATTDQLHGNGHFKRELAQQANELDRVNSELQETKKKNEELHKRLQDALSESEKMKESKALLTRQTHVRGKEQDGDGDDIVEERTQRVENASNLLEMPDRHERLRQETIDGQEDIQSVKSELQKTAEHNKNLEERLVFYEKEVSKSQLLQTTATRLRKERQDLQNRLKEFENTATRLRKERQDLRHRNAELEHEIAQSRQELERLSSDLRQSEEERANLSRRLENADGDSEKVKDLEAQILYLQNEKKQGEDRLKRIERETVKREKLQTQSRAFGEERGSLPEQSPRLKERLEKQQTEIERITLELQQTEAEKHELKSRLGNAGQGSKRLDALEVQMIYLQSEKKAAEERLQRLEREKSTTESVVTTSGQYEKEKEDIGKSNSRLQKQVEQQQTYIQILTMDKEKLQEVNQNLQDRVKEAEVMPKKIEDLEVQLIYLQNDKKETEKRMQRKVQQQQSEIQRMKSQLEKAQELYDDLQTRFSQVASAQLTHDNPNITDLSDSNRPIKLADAYSELYDNEWTEAFSALDEDKSNALNETQIVIQLRDILLDCFERCTNTSNRQLLGIKSLLFSPSTTSSTVGLPSGHDLTKEQAKTINELRKKTAAQAIGSLQEKMTKSTSHSRQHKAVEDFVKKCVELCWLMVVQSPPVFINGRYKSGGPFDKDAFKAFTKTGDKIDYVVWPPLYLHEKGPILCKGTAQGRE